MLYCVYVIANNSDCTVLACHVFAFLLKIPVLKMSKNMNFYCLNDRFDWYQTETHVVVTLMIKKSKKENVNVDYGEKTVRKLVSLSCMGKKLSILALFFFFFKILQDVLVPVYGQFENEIPTVFVLFS